MPTPLIHWWPPAGNGTSYQVRCPFSHPLVAPGCERDVLPGEMPTPPIRWWPLAVKGTSYLPLGRASPGRRRALCEDSGLHLRRRRSDWCWPESCSPARLLLPVAKEEGRHLSNPSPAGRFHPRGPRPKTSLKKLYD
ncbi:hypothetical protein NDU88_001285 [Pleurodeles waltl]|uniref:Uncharacterized protein n=1 Tax=Pleurodeles waltl TaxID=8319 RepID=A0AAV7V9R8_PLEWA|nr:hypothetical protein NDU88_001285 [Pleurodeles waltl]